MKDARFSKFILFINALVPLALLLWDVYHKRVGANPAEFMTRTTGMLTLVFLTSFERYFNLRSVPGDVASRPFIALGMAAFLMMIPLAITSTNKMVKRLGGKRWNRLHKLVYFAGVAGALHYWLLVKSDTRLPLTFAFILLLLLGHRLFVKFYPPGNLAPRGTLLPRD